MNNNNLKLEELKILKEDLKEEVRILRRKKYKKYVLPVMYILIGFFLLFIEYTNPNLFLIGIIFFQ